MRPIQQDDIQDEFDRKPLKRWCYQYKRYNIVKATNKTNAIKMLKQHYNIDASREDVQDFNVVKYTERYKNLNQ